MKKHSFPALLLAVIFSVLFLHTAWEKSPTWDEVGYLGLGAYLLKTGRWDVPAAGSHPPLAFYAHALPSFLYPIDWRVWDRAGHRPRDIEFLRAADIKRGNALLLDRAYDGEHYFFASRALLLPLLALPFFFLLHRWACQLHGPQGGLLVLLLFSLSPNILAHGPLLNTDFALACTFGAAVYAFRRLLLAPSPRALLLAGTALGLALLSKLTALVLLPVLFLLLFWFARFAGVEAGRALQALWPRHPPLPLALGLSYLATVGLALLVLWAGYGFQDEPYFLTLHSQLWDVSTGHSAYLMGHYSDRGWWYYFPLALLIKTPLPTLALAALGLGLLVADRRPSGRLELGFLLLPPLLLSLLFVLGNAKNIGLRYLLPVFPFLFLMAGAALRADRSAWLRRAAAALCLWLAFGALRTHPHHLAYFNEAVGGPQNGYRYLVDSNLDWGQDLKGLKRYMEARGLERVKLSYFGTVDPALYDLRYEWLPSFVLPDPAPPALDLPTTGTIAISATNLVGVYMDMYGHGKDLFRWLEAYEPVARIGHSIFVYEIPDR